MNRYTVAAGTVAYSERDKPTDVTSKRRAGTKRASFKMSVDGMNHSIAHSIDASRRPEPPLTQTIGVRGPKQSIRVWRKSNG